MLVKLLERLIVGDLCPSCRSSSVWLEGLRWGSIGRGGGGKAGGLWGEEEDEVGYPGVRERGCGRLVSKAGTTSS